MKFSAGEAARKWACRRLICDQRTIAVALTLLLVAAPAQAPVIEQQQAPAETEKPAEPEKPAAEQRPAEPPPSSACRLALTDSIAIAPSIAAIRGPGACGGDDLVHLEAIVLPDKTRVPLKPGGTMRCTMASAIADWVRSDMAPLATGLGTRLSELDNFDSFDCRGRNRVVGAKMSEHGRANALDIRALKFANGQSIGLTERATPRELREKVLLSVCTRFSTVLGPGSDGYHEDHIHLDLAERRGNYKICQWDVWDQMPVIAPLMPAVRPDEAPPRQTAEAPPAEPAVAAPAAAEPEAVEPEPDHPPAKPKPKPRKRRAASSPFGFLR
jgi:hypothetical protein